MNLEKHSLDKTIYFTEKHPVYKTPYLFIHINLKYLLYFLSYAFFFSAFYLELILSQSIDPGQQFTWENSNMEVNKPKNRYANVIAYDHSRVVLTSVDGKSSWKHLTL